MGNTRVDWEEVVNWGIAKPQGESFQTAACKLVLGAAVYHIWKHMNDIRHTNNMNSDEHILKGLIGR
jgi:hypothetical protein